MPHRYSEVVEAIFETWLVSLENTDDQGKVIDPGVIKELRKLIEDGKINTAAQIRRLVDEFGGKYAA